MGPLSENHELYRGDSYTFTAQIKDDQEQAVDLTDFIIVLTVKSSLADEDNDAIIQLTSNDYIRKTENTGEIVVDVLPEHTKGKPTGEHHYDIEVTSPDDRKDTVLFGKFKIKPDVTIGD